MKRDIDKCVCGKYRDKHQWNKCPNGTGEFMPVPQPKEFNVVANRNLETIRKLWDSLPEESRNLFVYDFISAMNYLKSAVKQLPPEFTEKVPALILAEASKVMMPPPFGKSMDDFLKELAQVLPAISPFVRQLFGD